MPAAEICKPRGSCCSAVASTARSCTASVAEEPLPPPLLDAIVSPLPVAAASAPVGSRGDPEAVINTDGTRTSSEPCDAHVAIAIPYTLAWPSVLMPTVNDAPYGKSSNSTPRKGKLYGSSGGAAAGDVRVESAALHSPPPRASAGDSVATALSPSCCSPPAASAPPAHSAKPQVSLYVNHTPHVAASGHSVPAAGRRGSSAVMVVTTLASSPTQ
ncbi:hypothetical protein Vretimale_17597 [Volvox reticuliferus]|uniref:Uncharacterized protein n=1 Tax=Volvox reticuliferus TaxID=1737510 RepID=A0A8J4GVL9_9CHLO|nr:hypothetical protein Vretimale_17597 [Volvox reticuliferus]